MKAVVFDLYGKIAHFRRPDTTATHMSYPFIPPTAAKGLVGAVLGIEDFVTNDRIGIRLLRPVLSVAQRMSMFGKDGVNFNRPTTIELLVNPGYRIYYVGEEYAEPLAEMLREGRSVYPTYLGSAYCLTKPALHDIRDDVRFLTPKSGEVWRSQSVIPVAAIKNIVMEPDRQYCRSGGYFRKYVGQRTFEGSVNFIYESQGKPISFVPSNEGQGSSFVWMEWDGETVCLI